MRIDHAEQVHAVLVDPAVQVVLGAGQGFLDDQPQRAAGVRQTFGGDAVERTEHAPQGPALDCGKAGEPDKVGAPVNAPRQNGEGAPRRLHMARKGQGLGAAGAAQRIQRDVGDVGFRANLLQHASRVQLVLACEDRFGRGAGQSAALGHQRRHQRALKFMVRQHAGPVLTPRTLHLQVGKAVEVEAGHAELAEQSGGIKAAPVKVHAGSLQPGMRDGVIVLIEQQANTPGRG